MRAHLPTRRRRGAVMIMALVIIGIVSFGFIAWVRLLGQRARAGEFEDQNARRRLTVLNAKTVAREYMLVKVLPSASDSNGLPKFTPFSSSGTGLGTAETSTWISNDTDLKAPLIFADKVPLNPFSPTWDYTFGRKFVFKAPWQGLTFNALGEVWTDDFSTIDGFLNSRNPALGGDLLIAHTRGGAAPALSGNINIFGGFIQFATAGGYTVRRSASTDTSIQLTGALPSNMAATPLSSGTGYAGQLNVINNTSNTGVSLQHRLEATAASAVEANRAAAMIYLSKTKTSTDAAVTWTGSGAATITPFSATTNDCPNVVINDGVGELIILGQTGATAQSAAAGRPAQAIIINQTSSTSPRLATLRLRGTNGRRTLLALKSAAATAPEITIQVEDTATTSVSNMIILAENVKLKFLFSTVSPYKATALTLYGGIQTDSTLTGPIGANKLDLRLQTAPQGLITMSPRIGWVETFLERDDQF